MTDPHRDPASATSAKPATPGAWAVVRAAIRGEPYDYTQGSLDRALVLLAIPMMLEMIMESLFAVVDVYWVGRLGADAVAAVGLTESLLALLYALAMGLAMAATASVARRVGEKNLDEASAAAAQAIVLGVMVSIPIAIGGALYASKLLAAMGAPTGPIAMGSRYTSIMMASSGSILLLFLINAAFRGAGDAAVAMRVLWVANGLNILLGPLFIFGFRMGVTGAAVATTLGRSIGVAYQLYVLLSRKSILRLRAAHFVPKWNALVSMLSVSIGGIFQSLVGTASWIVQMRFMAAFGAAAVAGYTIGIRVIVFAILPAWGLANAAATLVGQSLGAKDPERAERAVMRSCLWNTALLSAVGVVFFVFAGPIVGAFTSDPAVRAFGTTTLRIVSVGYPFYGFGMGFGAAFNGAGDTRTPTWLNVICFWMIEIPLSWALSHVARMGPAGVCTAVAVGFSALAVVSYFVFRVGAWKQARA